MGAFLPFRTDRLGAAAVRAPPTPRPFAAYRSDPDVARYQSWDAPYTLETARRFVASQSTFDGPVPGDWVQIAVDARRTARRRRRRAASTPTGSVATIGYSLATAEQGRGLAREAVGAVVGRLFDDLGVHRVEADARPRQRRVGANSSRTSASSTRAPPARPCAVATRGPTTPGTG